MNTQELNRIDPLKKQPEQGVGGSLTSHTVAGEGKALSGLPAYRQAGVGGSGAQAPIIDMSPMDPPEAYAPPAMKRIPLLVLHPFLRKFGEEHAFFMEELKIFEETILSIQKTGFTKELDGKLKHFFHFFDSDFIPHSQLEEAALFPLLHKRLIANGEHSKSEVSTTAVDLMKADHLKAMQLAAVALNFLGLAFRLPDEKSRLIVLDAALEEGKNLVELLRLHIFREDNVVFSMAHHLISRDEFDGMQSRLS